MKKFIGIWLVILMSCMFTMSMNTLYAADPVPVVETTSNTSVVVPAIVASESIPEVVSEKVSEGWMHIIGVYAGLVGGVLKPILYALLAALALVIRKKFGSEVAAITDTLFTSLVNRSVDYANGWAKKQSDKPAGNKKMQVALDFLAPLLVKYNLPTMAKDKIIEEIEKHLLVTGK